MTGSFGRERSTRKRNYRPITVIFWWVEVSACLPNAFSGEEQQCLRFPAGDLCGSCGSGGGGGSGGGSLERERWMVVGRVELEAHRVWNRKDRGRRTGGQA